MARRHLVVLLDPRPYRGDPACQVRAYRGHVEVFWAGRWEAWAPPQVLDPTLAVAAAEMIQGWRDEGKPWPPPWNDVRMLGVG